MLSFMHEKTCLILIYSSLAGAPVSLEAKDRSYYQLHLSWQPPQKGYIPTHYILEKREEGSLIWVRIDMIPAEENTEYKVEGLKAATWYSFRVIAKFVKGKSKPRETERPVQTKPIRSKCFLLYIAKFTCGLKKAKICRHFSISIFIGLCFYLLIVITPLHNEVDQGFNISGLDSLCVA